MHRNLYLAGSIRTVRKLCKHWRKNLDVRGSSVKSEAPSVLLAPDLCIWASGPKQRSEVKKIIL